MYLRVYKVLFIHLILYLLKNFPLYLVYHVKSLPLYLSVNHVNKLMMLFNCYLNYAYLVSTVTIKNVCLSVCLSVYRFVRMYQLNNIRKNIKGILLITRKHSKRAKLRQFNMVENKIIPNDIYYIDDDVINSMWRVCDVILPVTSYIFTLCSYDLLFMTTSIFRHV